jgi:predicted PurR-regulated permease PerM
MKGEINMKKVFGGVIIGGIVGIILSIIGTIFGKKHNDEIED